MLTTDSSYTPEENARIEKINEVFEAIEDDIVENWSASDVKNEELDTRSGCMDYISGHDIALMCDSREERLILADSLYDFICDNLPDMEELEKDEEDDEDTGTPIWFYEPSNN